MLIAIDGPSGVGKGTVARILGHRLGIPYFDTGAMYRAVALAALDRGIEPENHEAVVRLAAEVELELVPEDGAFAVWLEGEPVEERIRTPEVGQATSTIATYPEVRRRMVELQRRYGRRHGGVMEGRDIGTRVFPEARWKFFLDARPEVRIERRYLQLRETGQEVSREAVAREVARRDERDRNRSDSPLTRDASYVYLDTSELSIDEVVAQMLSAIEAATD